MNRSRYFKAHFFGSDNKQMFWLLTFFLFSSLTYTQSCNEPITAFVTTMAELRTTISNTANHPGEVTITIKDGIYVSDGFNMIFFVDRMHLDCTYKIQAETIGGVEFVGMHMLFLQHGQFHIDGIKFTRTQHHVAKGNVRFTEANNSILENCSFYDVIDSIDVNKSYTYVQMLRGAFNTIRNCDFEYKHSKGHVVLVQVDTTQAHQAERAHHKILDCHFRGQYLPSFGSMIAIGLSGDPRSETSHIFSHVLVQNNIFEDYNVNPNDDTDVFGYDEVISNKSSGNQYIGNRFLNCNGRLKLRSGSHCTIESNRFIRETSKNRPNSAGLRFNGPGHQIINNYFENIKAHSIYIYCGYGPMKYQLLAGEVQPCYQNPDSVTIAYNTMINTTDEALSPVGLVYFDLPANASCPASFVNQIPKHMSFENNIICSYGASTSKPFFLLRGNTGSTPPPSQTMPNSLLNNNIFYRNQTSGLAFQNINFAEVQQHFITDPLLQFSGQEYLPAPNSIAANRADASNDTGITTDINSILRPFGTADIGCHEFEQNNCQFNLDMNGEIASDLYKVSNTISISSATIKFGDNVLFQAANGIMIDTTFTIELGGNFTGEIVNCE